jgi:hypothetical protein
VLWIASFKTPASPHGEEGGAQSAQRSRNDFDPSRSRNYLIHLTVVVPGDWFKSTHRYQPTPWSGKRKWSPVSFFDPRLDGVGGPGGGTFRFDSPRLSFWARVCNTSGRPGRH